MTMDGKVIGKIKTEGGVKEMNIFKSSHLGISHFKVPVEGLNVSWLEGHGRNVTS